MDGAGGSAGSDVRRRPWWEAHPDRLKAETDALRRHGARYRTVRRPVGVGNPHREMNVRWPNPDKERMPELGDWIDLCVTFAKLHPWFEPAVRLRNDVPVLGRHAAALTRELCLFADPGVWRPDWLLADVLARQLPNIINASGPEMPTAGVEIHEAVGAQTWLEDESRQYSLVYDSAAAAGDNAVGGRARVRYATRPDGGTIFAIESFHLGKSHSRTDAWSGWSALKASQFPWFDLGRELTPADSADGLWSELSDRVGDRELFLLVRYPDETQYRREGFGWLLLCRPLADSPIRRGWAFGRPAGPSDLASRRPGTEGLASRSARIVGVGAIGHVVALELARAGFGELILIDGDIAEPCTASRQTPVTSAGMTKVAAVQVLIEQYAPHCSVKALPLRIGGPSDWGIADVLLSESEVAIDCTASPAVTRYLSMRARRAGVPVISATATYGGFGGVVAQLSPAVSAACWDCVELWRGVGAVTFPPEESDSRMQAGCSAPSYAALGVDLMDVATQAVRSAITIAEHGLAETSVDVLSLRDCQGDRQLPSWTAHRGVEVHPACRRH